MPPDASRRAARGYYHAIYGLALLLGISPLASVASLDLSQCIGPLGMESGAIKDDMISASSSFEDSTVGPHNARIRVDQNGGAWCPKTTIGKEAGEWLEIDLGSVHALTATETQGRFGNGQGVEFSEHYLLEYYRPRLGKWVRFRTRDENEILDANSNTYTAVKNDLNPVVLASRVRFHPYSHHKRTVCMRVEVYGCSWDDGLLSYSIPQGDLRGSAYKFYDFTYDGEWMPGNYLRNGLGCLTDGDYGPDNFKLSYYAQNRGWVGWKKTPERDYVELLFEFDVVREFHSVTVYTNNQFTREVAVFSEAKAFFSIAGRTFNPDPVFHAPMEDTIFEESRNVTMKLHRRVARFVKLQLRFASKWIMVSEVSFQSTPARGQYPPEEDERDAVQSSVERAESHGLGDAHEVRGAGEGKEEAPAPAEKEKAGPNSDSGGSGGSSSATSSESSGSRSPSLMAIIIGVLTSVILLLAGVIFFIVNRNRQRKWLSPGGAGAGGPAGRTLRTLGPEAGAGPAGPQLGEKMALTGEPNGTFLHHPYAVAGPGSTFIMATSDTTGSSGSKGSTGTPLHSHQILQATLPKLDSNYNAPHPLATPRTLRSAGPHSTATPLGGRKTFPPLPRLQIPPPPPLSGDVTGAGEAVYTEPGTYAEPYKALRYSPYYGYGPVLSEIEDGLMKQSLLSDASCGDYAVPMVKQQQQQQQQLFPGGRLSSVSSGSSAGTGNRPKTNLTLNPAASPSQLRKVMASNGSLRQQHAKLLEAAATSMVSSSSDVDDTEEDERQPLRESEFKPAATFFESDSLRAMRARLETHIVPKLTGNQLSLRQRLSEGAFGTVYIADALGLPEYGGEPLDAAAVLGQQSLPRRLVAVKFLSEAADEQEKSEFIREVRLLSVLEDSNISRVLGLCSDQAPYFVAMEYLEHGDLNQFLRNHLPEGTSPLPAGTKTLSFGTLMHLASQVASGMKYLESLNFVHRDLATRNCLVGKSYHLKICDFGSDNPLYARDYYEMDSHLLIPLRWMAWESVLLCKYTTKSDVWSFGVCLWEILQLSSVRPYAHLDDANLLTELTALQNGNATLSCRLERPPTCPKDLYELMCECWKRDAAARPSFREIHLFLQRKNLGYSPQ